MFLQLHARFVDSVTEDSLPYFGYSVGLWYPWGWGW